ncbi:hypothetical protein ACQ86N_12640 [Puia sp. P3]|uniref:hypothetical protein n=1 Tax=Puia sp. P3 TaxID=3423952 RepID=UPI003D67AA14
MQKILTRISCYVLVCFKSSFLSYGQSIRVLVMAQDVHLAITSNLFAISLF